jgi:hypothetical protein
MHKNSSDDFRSFNQGWKSHRNVLSRLQVRYRLKCGAGSMVNRWIFFPKVTDSSAYAGYENTIYRYRALTICTETQIVPTSLLRQFGNNNYDDDDDD